jgi:type IV fimbrial biogenesis protein FimT
MKGVSLVELMVAVAVAAILASLAAPSFSTMLANNKVRTGADGILAGLQLARTEAIRRNTNVSFTLNTGTGWTVAVVSPATTIQVRPTNEAGANLQVTTLNDQTSLTFTSTGIVSGYNPTATLTKITVAPPTGVNAADSLQIDIFAGGQARMCNLAITTVNDPRGC